MGKHKKECRKNYLKRRRKMLKERKAQEENPTSHLQEEEKEETTSTPAESVIDEPNPKKRRGNDGHATFCANAQYRTLGELPPELQFNPMKDNLYFSFVKFFENKRKLQKLIQNPLGDH
ncbi:unnamed protein product [Porites lobata]|uniref:Uncharacterized protein n=1 Tax=Porites lobata TaxID=104759 RepID=A0ABN8MUD8_9CNID|nr:unnamed protein product [Porites lobata]CAH3104724.1 unnamed protein product [Porites lobata]